MDGGVSPDRVFYRWSAGSWQSIAKGNHILLPHGAPWCDDFNVSVGPFEVGQGTGISRISVEDAFRVSNAITAANTFSSQNSIWVLIGVGQRSKGFSVLKHTLFTRKKVPHSI